MAEDTATTDAPASDVQAPDITPDDFLADEQESPKAEPSPAKPEAKAKAEVKPEAKDTELKSTTSKETKDVEAKAKAEATPEVPDVPTKDKENEPDEKSEGDVDKPEDKPTKADERKTQLNTEIRDLVSQRNALKESVAKANSEVYQPATEQELTDDGMSATDAKVESLRQAIEMKDYNDKVADTQLTIESESNRVLTDFAWANPDSPEFKEELSNEAAQLLQANLILDPNTNQVIGSNISPYQLYKTLDRASGISAVQGQLKGQQAAQEMAANADTPANAAPAKKPENPLTKLWEEPL